MFSAAARFILTLTALAPVAFTYAWAFWSQDKRLSLGLGCICAIMIVACITLLNKARSLVEEVSVDISSAETADRENFSLLLLYISPLFADKISDLNWSLWAPIIIVFGVITATGYNYHYSPLLGMLKWHAYRVTASNGITYALLTKRQLRSALGTIKVRQLTEYVLIEFKG